VRPIDTAAAVVAGDTALPPAGDSILLTPAIARLQVVAPPNAIVQLDGQTAVRGGQGWRWDSLNPGPHVVSARLPTALPGCPTADGRQTFSLKPGEQRTVRLRDLALCGELSLRVQPAQARYTLQPVRGGPAREGSLPLPEPLVLPAGTYSLKLNAPLCSEYRQDTLTVPAGGPRRVLSTRLICD
jgi:hypothetical protein